MDRSGDFSSPSCRWPWRIDSNREHPETDAMAMVGQLTESILGTGRGTRTGMPEDRRFLVPGWGGTTTSDVPSDLNAGIYAC